MQRVLAQVAALEQMVVMFRLGADSESVPSPSHRRESGPAAPAGLPVR